MDSIGGERVTLAVAGDGVSDDLNSSSSNSFVEAFLISKLFSTSPKSSCSPLAEHHPVNESHNSSRCPIKKCLAPYERPTLRTATAAAAAISGVKPGELPVDGIKKLHVLVGDGGGDPLSLTISDTLNNNINNSNSTLTMAANTTTSVTICDTDLNANTSISCQQQQQQQPGSTLMEQPRGVIEHNQLKQQQQHHLHHHQIVIDNNLADQKNNTTTVINFNTISVNCNGCHSSNNNINSSECCASSSEKGPMNSASDSASNINSSNDNNNNISTSPSSSSSDSGGAGTNGRLLSNCLSALNFVSGNRNSSSSIGSSAAVMGNRNSSGGCSSKSADEATTTATGTNTRVMCDHCTKQQKKHKSTPRGSGGKSAKLCKSGQPGGSTSCLEATTATTTTDLLAVPATTTTATTPNKSKRTNWTFSRFNCAKLKSSKSSSNLKSPDSSSYCTCPPETTPDRVSLMSQLSTSTSASSIQSTASSSSSSSSSVSLNLTTTTTTSTSAQNQQLPQQQHQLLSSSQLLGMNKSGELLQQSQQLQQSQPLLVISRLSGEFAAEDCDERARQQREREIEDGVEAPPGYLPRYQLNRIQTAAANNCRSTIANAVATEPGTIGSGLVAVNMISQQQQPRQSPFTLMSGERPMMMHEFMEHSQPLWPHLMCRTTMTAPTAAPAPRIHSQVDYIHCLVPDLQKITSCSFYWGKMDRYRAEKLLEGKPEGTFLLRDSAQEEFLFSVSFRKYGRSLHARIEQFNHKFSFDSHDPGVYTANTVTGLLEHYKDPTCVMFFEPMLALPLNRNFCFSLQQLCRATIVSQTTYDNIGELSLPDLMKGYLKEYHYKQKVRVKMFDEL